MDELGDPRILVTCELRVRHVERSSINLLRAARLEATPPSLPPSRHGCRAGRIM